MGRKELSHLGVSLKGLMQPAKGVQQRAGAQGAQEGMEVKLKETITL